MRRVYGERISENTFYFVEKLGIALYNEYPDSAPRYLGAMRLYTNYGHKTSSWPLVCVGRDAQARRTNYAAIVLDWLQICHETHPECSQNTKVALPTRVLEVNKMNSKQIQLRMTHANETGAYIALSHCWGGKIDMKTTSENINARLESISFANLPKTFQDAVTVTRELGVKYLWIDALCIIQDDANDWVNESKNMAAVYKDAYMVLGADMSTDSNGGFLDPSEGAYNQDGEPLAVVDSEMTSIFVRGHRDHGALCVMLPSWKTMYEHYIPASPLSKRAWTLQEQFLATRMTHFDSREIIWQCDSALSCECMELDNGPREVSGRYAYIQALKSSSTEKIQSLVQNRGRYRPKKHN